ncbi:MAG: lamin tail domain-containing protein [Candidatus Heimdallarchaeota archaeon]|nr:lamin tail domain-containing protein [Candidatus Heimdallarchaeota archaeon]
MAMKFRWIYILLILFSCVVLENAVQADVPGTIIITEVLYDAPNNDDTEEWIEIFNPLTVDISLTGWTLNDNVGSFELSGTIISGGYLIIAKDISAFNSLYDIDPDIPGLNLALGNSGDLIRLIDANGIEVDMVAWENEIDGWDIVAVDTTIHRKANTDTNSVDDWENSNSLGAPRSGPYEVSPPDLTAPEVTLNLENDSTVSGIVSISIQASDFGYIVSYELFIDDELVTSSSSYSWNSREENDGWHTIKARAQDGSGNWGQEIINVFVDNSNYTPVSQEVKVMSYNIEDSGANADWLNVVKAENPDIIVYIETGSWDDNANTLFNQHLTELNEYFSEEPPYVGNTAQSIAYSTSGEAIMSRFPILSTIQLQEVDLDDGTIYDVSHDFMVWEVDLATEIVYIIGAHLKCCSGEENELKREKAQEGIINFMDELGDVPIIYTGDMNSYSPFDTGELAPEGDLDDGPLSMLLNPTDGEYANYASRIHTFVDVFRVLNPTDPGYTYGHQNSEYESRIDFIIANQHFFLDLINSTTGDVGPANSGSDHYSVDVYFTAGNLELPDIDQISILLSYTTNTTTELPEPPVMYSFSTLIMLLVIINRSMKKRQICAY